MSESDRQTVKDAAPTRERAIADTFVALAGNLVSDYDVVDVLDRLVRRCVQLLAVDAAGILLDDQTGGMAVMAASDDDIRVLEVFQVQHAEGPCRDCLLSGEPVTSADLSSDHQRWPRFVQAALDTGIRAVVAVPLRLHEGTLGALGLFQNQPRQLSADDQRLAQAFADVASIGIIQHRTIHRSAMLAEQLRVALDSRVVIEQAKGVLAERLQIECSEAFVLLRKYCRDHNLKLTAAAEAVVSDRLDIAGS